jgi:TonB family protein
MNRLRTKCFIATTACHGLLLGILLFGSALMPSREEPVSSTIKFYSAVKISDLLSSGGDANASVPVAPPAPVATPAKPASAPPAPQVKPKPAPVIVKPLPAPKAVVEPSKPRVEPPKLTRATPKNSTPKVEPELPTKPEPHKVVINPESLKLAVRKSTDLAKQQQQEAAAAAAAAAAAEQKRRAQQFAEAYKKIGQDLSSKPLVDLGTTPGAGTPGELTVNYRDIIASKYYNAWSAPPDLDEATPVVIASVTIARDGSVVTAHITKPSGNASMDRSIAKVLETVTFIEPFPASFKEQERTVTIKFNLQAKRQTG